MSYPMPADVDEVARFERCFGAHYTDIARYCARRCRDPHDAEDATTETFAVAWRRRIDLPSEPDDRLWLFGVARRVVANQHRGHERRRRLLDRLRLHRGPGDELDPSQLMLGAGPDAGAIRAALEALPDAPRELLLLAGWEGLAVHEIAQVLGVPGPVVSRRLHRARARFAQLLRAENPTDAAGDAAVGGHVPVEPSPH